MPKYNGHKNRNHWNVALWIANDEGLYRYALALKKQHHNADAAAREFIASLAEAKITATPDGAPYSLSAVRAAIAGL